MERVQRYLGIANWKLQGDEYDLETSIYGIEVCPWNGSDYFGVLNVNVKYEDVQLCPLWGKFINSLIVCPNSHLKSLTLNRIQLTIEALEVLIPAIAPKHLTSLSLSNANLLTRL